MSDVRMCDHGVAKFRCRDCIARDLVSVGMREEQAEQLATCLVFSDVQLTDNLRLVRT